MECLCLFMHIQGSVSGAFSVTWLGPVPVNIGNMDFIFFKALPSRKLFIKDLIDMLKSSTSGTMHNVVLSNVV